MDEQKPEGASATNIKVDIENGQVFFSDEIAVIHNPTKLILDFKSVTPRFDIRNNEFQPLVIKHNVVLMDIHMAKNFLNTLKENIATYEKQFGKIEEPKALKKAVKNANKKIKKQTQSETAPSYFG